MSWRLAKSLERLRQQVDAMAPNRDRSADGTIGDAAHASRNSDHNPWVKDSSGQPVVTAIDLTHDPVDGVDAMRLVAGIVAARDSRVKYLIHARQIWRAYPQPTRGIVAWKPERYDGSNPHTRHVHVSVQPVEKLYDNARAWQLAPPVASSRVVAGGVVARVWVSGDAVLVFTNDQEATVKLTYPNVFDATPHVVATPGSTDYVAGTWSNSRTGCTLALRHLGGPVTTTVHCRWIAAGD